MSLAERLLTALGVYFLSISSSHQATDVQLVLLGLPPHRDRDYCIGSNFWKFYLIRTGFTSGELVSLVKVL